MPASEILRLVFGFVAVLAMIGACAYAARKAGLSSLAGAGGKKRRLAISEALPLDARRRLALVRCDEKEYLVILGPSGETLLDGGIEAPAMSEATSAEIDVNSFPGFGALVGRLASSKPSGGHKEVA